jgi:hypothetical protein
MSWCSSDRRSPSRNCEDRARRDPLEHPSLQIEPGVSVGGVLATQRAETALDALISAGEPITFRGLAKTAGVSIDFLYRSPVRARIETLRAERDSAPPAPRSVEVSATTTQSNVVRALTAQITELKQLHRAETEQLRAALAAAHGENLELRRQLGRQHRPPAA